LLTESAISHHHIVTCRLLHSQPASFSAASLTAFTVASLATWLFHSQPIVTRRLLHSQPGCFTRSLCRLLHSQPGCFTRSLCRLLHSQPGCFTRSLHSCFTRNMIVPLTIPLSQLHICIHSSMLIKQSCSAGWVGGENRHSDHSECHKSRRCRDEMIKN